MKITLVYLVVALSLLPYLKLVPTASDTQPNAMIASVFLMLAIRKRSSPPFPIRLLWVLPPVALVIFLYEISTGFGVLFSTRSLYNYIALPCIATAVALTRDQVWKVLIPVTNAINVLYLIIGSTQILTGRQLIGAFVGGGARAENYDLSYRGAVGLAPEPTFYGTVIFVFLIIYFLAGMENSWWGLLCVFQIVALSRSTMVILFLVIVLAIRAIVAKRILALAAGIACTGLIILIVINIGYFEGSRVRDVLMMSIDDPYALFRRDFSITSRLLHAWYGTIAVFRQFGFPNGFAGFPDYYNGMVANVAWLDPLTKMGVVCDPNSSIMSGLGSLFFELGIIGAIVPFSLALATKRFYGRLSAERAIVFFSGMLLVLASGIHIGIPFVGLIWGLIGSGKRLRSRPADYVGERRLNWTSYDSLIPIAQLPESSSRMLNT